MQGDIGSDPRGRNVFCRPGFPNVTIDFLVIACGLF